MQSVRLKIRKETIKNVVSRMGRIPKFTKLQRDNMENENFIECVRQAAYTLCRYSYCEIYSCYEVILIKNIIDETNLTTHDNTEAFHVLISINMIAPMIYENLILDFNNPENIKLPLKLEKKELPDPHFYRPKNRYFCELDDLRKNARGFFLKMQIPKYHIKKRVKRSLSSHPQTLFDFR